LKGEISVFSLSASPNQQKGSASSTDLSPQSIKETVSAACIASKRLISS
jgi:predicted Zn-dependent protease